MVVMISGICYRRGRLAGHNGGGCLMTKRSEAMNLTFSFLHQATNE